MEQILHRKHGYKTEAGEKLVRVKMNSSVVATVPLQFTVPLLILGGLWGDRGGGHNDPGSSKPEPNYLPSDYTAYPDIGVAYKYHEVLVSWHEARKRCVLEGGYLAVIDTQAKLDYVVNLKRSTTILNAWIGIHKFYDPAEWSTINNGSPVTYFVWYPGRPWNNSTSCCIGLDYDSSLKMRHFDENCAGLRKFICEIPIPRKSGPPYS